ncbi:GntR family transcriptional regulator [Agrobacterium sp. B1(2019)]|uniref:GntR family transcriptional regulator n=1 Tax=Agrobacterium sp. B1(2019) TaxID=2607032 RepID=UPI0011EF17C5|nr:GntR family transcriptional regulator [Agrobacterium sp. B1(2019)]TZG31769.1 GntR family transcriptional regulator [Agrobacterium sp. B1(2019)]
MNSLVKVTLAEQAHQELRARIVSGRLRGGERLLPNELAADLGISPTPVKEACLKLEADGLVINSSRRGMVVRDFTVEDVEELYAARMLLEKGAVEVAFDAGQLDGALHAELLESLAKHREFAKGSTLDELSKALFYDRSFHATLVSAARIPVISGSHERILDQTHTVFVSILGAYARSVEEHQNIADAIAAGGKAQIVDALWRHLERSRQNTLRQVRLLKEAGA